MSACIIISVLALVGCGTTTPAKVTSPQNPNTTTEIPNVSSYPSPVAQNFYGSNGYPIAGNEQQAFTEPIPIPPQSAPEPLTGKVSISGVLYSSTSNIILRNTQAYLTLASGVGNDQLNPVLGGPKPQIGDILFTTDEKGNFELNNVPAGKYFIVVWAPLSWTVVMKSKTDANAMLMNLQAGSKTPLGVLFVSWP
jgi:hypothetical protein